MSPAPPTQPRYVLSSDVGGTFTDTLLLDLSTGQTWSTKVPSRRRQQEIPVRDGTAALFATRGAPRDIDPAECAFYHGSTVATNALLERRVAKVAFVTNLGFEDLLEIRRQNRPALYDLTQTRPLPLVPRALCMGIPMRRSAQGENLGADAQTVHARLREIATACQDQGVESIAVGLLHADLFPDDEKYVATELVKLLPGIPVGTSHAAWPEPREVERFETTVVDAALRPMMKPYLARLAAAWAQAVRAAGVPAVRVMDSVGALQHADSAAEHPAALLLSGPAGGVRAAVSLGATLAIDPLVTFDVGGTSTDVALVQSGAVTRARDTRVAGFGVRFPALEIHTLGAGGGSVLWRDAGGHLQVGPMSQGARPGPACYGNGGDKPTLTDALLLAGRIPDGLVFGPRTKPQRKAAFRVLEQLAGALRLPLESVVSGAIRLAVAAVAGGVHAVSTHRGYDPRAAHICAYGGAGPLLAAELANELGAAGVVVPWDAGVFSARGLATAPVVERRAVGVDWVASPHPSDAEVRTWDEQLAGAVEEADPAGAGARVVRIALRYVGQSYELEIIPEAAMSVVALRAAFERAHTRAYGHAAPEQDMQAVRVVVERVLETPDPGWQVAASALDHHPRPDGLARETILWDTSRGHGASSGAGEVSARVIWRPELSPGQALAGPLVIADATATTYVPPGWQVAVDAQTRALLLRREQELAP